jgi:hypothetical protein
MGARDRHIYPCYVLLDQVPAEFLERVRLRLEQHIDQTESSPKQK